MHLFFHPIEIVFRYRDPQLQVVKTHLHVQYESKIGAILDFTHNAISKIFSDYTISPSNKFNGHFSFVSLKD